MTLVADETGISWGTPPEIFRVYDRDTDPIGKDGYPLAWHSLDISKPGTAPGIKHIVRERAGKRCLRCLHPYGYAPPDPPWKPEHEKGPGEWSPCDERCTHTQPIRVWDTARDDWVYYPEPNLPWTSAPALASAYALTQKVEAQWRILTVHHLNGDKPDLRWWNLVALCQRCHLQIQRKVIMGRIWPWEHSPWFRPFAAGYYASAYLGEDLTREETEARQDELLALERAA